MTAKTEDNIRSFGLALLALAGALMAMCCGTFLLGGVLHAWFFPVAVALSLVVPNRRRIDVRTSLSYLLFIAVTLLVTGAVYDRTYDSCGYHQEIIAWLIDGWNPYSLSSPPGEMTPWALHYAKFMETCQACIVMATGHLETGKAFNFILVGAMCCLAWAELRRRRSAWSTAAITLVIVANPVLVSQIFTFYIDFAFYCYLVITLCCIIRIEEKNDSRTDWLVLALMILMAAGTKFNAFFNVCLTILAWIIWQLWHRQYLLFKKTTALSAIAGILAVCVFFYHPYLTNLIGYGNLFYPLLGADTDINMLGNTPDIFMRNNRLVNFFQSLIYGPAYNARGVYYTEDTRVGGYGVFMLPIMLVTGWLAWEKRREWSPAVYYTLAVTLLSCFAFGQSWCARFNPQLWLVGVVGAIYAGPGLWRRAIVIMAALTIACGHINLKTKINYTIETRKVVARMRGHTQRVPRITKQHALKLKEWGIEYEVVDSVDTSKCIMLPNWFLIEVNPASSAPN